MSALASMVTESGTACPSYTSAGAISSLIWASGPDAVSSGSTSTRTPAAAIRSIVEADSAAFPSLTTVTPPLPPLGIRAAARRSAPSRSLPDRSTLALTPEKAGRAAGRRIYHGIGAKGDHARLLPLWQAHERAADRFLRLRVNLACGIRHIHQHPPLRRARCGQDRRAGHGQRQHKAQKQARAERNPPARRPQAHR